MKRKKREKVNIRVTFTQRENEQIDRLSERWNLKKSNVVKMLFINFRDRFTDKEHIILEKMAHAYDSRMVSEFPYNATLTVTWEMAVDIDRMCAQMGCIQRSVLIRIFVVQELYQMEQEEKKAG